MEEIFDEKLLDALEYARKLEVAGEQEASKIICRRCVEENASHKGKDMLRFFYGKNVYDELQNAVSAMEYIFVARCAAAVFEVASEKEAAASANGWAKCDLRCNDPRMLEALTWLQKKGRRVQKTDAVHFKNMYRAVKNSGALTFAFSPAMMQESLTSILGKLVQGKARVTGAGRIE